MPFIEIPAIVGDAARLAALASYDVLDTPEEAAFDTIALRASQYCSTPVATVSFIDKDRQWIKARVGIDFRELPLDQAICRYALDHPGMFVIPDLSRDRRTKRHPMVRREPFARFYASTVLRSPEGQPLGVVCVLSHAPRRDGLSARETSALTALGDEAMALLNERRSTSRQMSDLRKILGSSATDLVDPPGHDLSRDEADMTAGELADQMIFLGLTTDDLAQMTGTSEPWIRRLLENAEPVPHWLSVLTLYWGLYGDALEIARQFAADRARRSG